MASKRLLAEHRLFRKSRITSRRVSSPCTAALNNQKTSNKRVTHDPGNDGVFRRHLHRPSLPRIREMEIVWNRRSAAAEERLLTAVKILRVSQLEFIKARLRGIEKDYISYSEFMKICSSDDHAIEFAKMLDQSGSVIVLGNIVYLRPHQVVKAIQSLIPNHDPRKIDELQEMEKEKAAIDTKAKSLVQHELWCGLAYFAVQTAAFMRLTFWELTWDVMEPICFFVTSTQFMAGYGFFLRTSKEPSFEGFFQSRFAAKQKHLFRVHNFDVERYNELKKACYNPAFSTKTTSLELDMTSQRILGFL